MLPRELYDTLTGTSLYRVLYSALHEQIEKSQPASLSSPPRMDLWLCCISDRLFLHLLSKAWMSCLAIHTIPWTLSLFFHIAESKSCEKVECKTLRSSTLRFSLLNLTSVESSEAFFMDNLSQWEQAVLVVVHLALRKEWETSQRETESGRDLT